MWLVKEPALPQLLHYAIDKEIVFESAFYGIKIFLYLFKKFCVVVKFTDEWVGSLSYLKYKIKLTKQEEK